MIWWLLGCAAAAYVGAVLGELSFHPEAWDDLFRFLSKMKARL